MIIIFSFSFWAFAVVVVFVSAYYERNGILTNTNEHKIGSFFLIINIIGKNLQIRRKI